MTREHYIPFNKEFLLEQQIAAFAENPEKVSDFKKLFEIIEHYYHYESFNLNRNLKQHYALYDPDLSEKEREQFINKSDFPVFKETLLKVLERGNYYRIDQEALDEAFNESDLVGLNLAIDFNAFKDFELYARGHHKAKEKVKKYFFWTKEVEIEYYDRVLIYLNYSDADYLKEKKVKLGKMPIDPGSIALKIFKRVPKNDLETVFPNAIPKMSLKDKLLLWVPGVFGGLSLLSAKVIPALINMYEAYQTGETIDLLNSKTSLNQGLIALGILGAYCFRQYNNFINKKIRYSKTLSDSLYFKNVGNNSGAFYSLLNSSEEEALKETILAYTFLHESEKSLTAEELDDKIESWFKTKLNTDLDFDVNDALAKLKSIGLGIETNGKWNVIRLNEALVAIDELWDNVFQYNQKVDSLKN
ncbi:TMEM143 family protein [Flavobacterium tyrosinilyticum]|uniref:TMEM143 family protein n=1 Tax=Flavobacterium tyrosinilyticum TaxID=1658740 RepID=UPI00202EB44B|nr:TMEM143 family protein [Flavobacterium tyrosinilyticum]MCM0664624.1 TMEM143 family protein [Flavobacterium tyrosinilyticum]